MRTLEAVFREFRSSQESGLKSQDVSLSHAQHGMNRLTPLPREPIWKKFLEKFDEPIIHILLAASLLKIIVDLFRTNPALGGMSLLLTVAVLAVGLLPRFRTWLPTALFSTALVLVLLSAVIGHPSIDGFAVMIAVILATGVAFAAEFQSDREFEALNSGKESSVVKVTRDGNFITIPLEQVAVGDLITLEAGDEIPADGRVVRANELSVDQALMTGESEPVRKHASSPDDSADGPEHPACLYRGTHVVDGAAQMLAIDVGDATMLGQIASRLAGGDSEADRSTSEGQRVQQRLTISKELTPLQLKLVQLAALISRIGYAAAVAIFLALFAKGIYDGAIHWPSSGEDLLAVARRLLDYFVVMVIVIVVAVPEGLPMSVTVSLALAMRKMTRANSLVRQLVACETIGSSTVICSDKTGTLTQNRMQVAQAGLTDRVIERGSVDWPQLQDAHRKLPRDGRPWDWMWSNMAINSTAHLEEKAGRTVVIGNSTEGALLFWLKELGIDFALARIDHPVHYQMHFSSERKRMTTVADFQGRQVAFVKGAPEWIVEHSEFVLEESGKVRPFSESDRTRVRASLAAASGRAMRTLAFAYRELPGQMPRDEESLHEMRHQIERGLIFTGFVAIRDPVRDDVPEAIRRCREAGIEVKMITGDNADTARAIAREIGLLDRPDALTMTSDEFHARPDDELAKDLSRLCVVARARPLDKLRLVKLLQRQNHVVAMTGDGTNDAPSLKAADVGLSMGITGTEVAKEASKIVLLDDSFATIVRAVHWGRALYENIQRFVQFQLTINVSALVIAFLAPFLGFGEPPFTVLQFLWINIIMDTFAAIALCSEPPQSGLMQLPPKRKDEPIVTRSMWNTILSTALFFIVVMVSLLLLMQRRPDGSPGWFAGPLTRADGSATWCDEFPQFTTRQVAIFFTVYVLFQVWNQINCRSLTPAISGLRGLGRNRVFLAITAAILLGQFLIVTFGGHVFKVEPLSATDWLAIAAFTSSVLAFSEIIRRIRLATARGGIS